MQSSNLFMQSLKHRESGGNGFIDAPGSVTIVGMRYFGLEMVKESEGSRKGGSILMLMDELVKVGQTMGYNMDGCMKNIEEIIESQGVDGVFR
ncbi:hypothetical protein Tco_1415454 [Tanacetum coccineum]